MSTLILGDFVFQDFEIPEVLPFGGDQRLAIKKLVGGTRVIDANGADRRPIEWAGIFFPTASQSALERALTLQQMQDAAQPLTLSWDELYLSVYIRTFEPDIRSGRIPYRITLEVLEDLTAPVYSSANWDADDLIGADLDSANTLTANAGDSALTGLMGSVSSAIASVSTFVGASISTVASVLQPINAAVRRVNVLTGNNDAILASVTTPGGVLPGVSVAANVAAFAAQSNATSSQVNLVQLSSLLGRMATNLGQINSSGRTVTVGGGNLYDIAAKEYGDASAWTQIAQANGISDPTLAGITTLIIPPYNNGTSGGILSS